ncbi:hypothetical protein FKM82_014771, partial [Ascaphus truei]
MYVLLTLLSLSLHPCLSVTIEQTPRALVIRPGEGVSLSCTVRAAGDPYIYWYRQGLGREPLRFISSSVGKGSVDELRLTHFKANRSSESDFSLSTERVNLSDAGTYYCAWSHTGVR